MNTIRRFWPFFTLFVFVIASIALTSTITTAESIYLDEEVYAWLEIGGSASGGGISDSLKAAEHPSLAISSDDKIIVAWHDRSSDNLEIYVRRWDGTAWAEMGAGSASGGGISSNSGNSLNPSLAISLNYGPIVAWHDNTSGNAEIYVFRWNGTAWVEMGSSSASGGGISNNSGQSRYPSLAISPDGSPVVAWHDNTSGNAEIYVLRWNGTAWVEMGGSSASGGGISNNSGDSTDPSLAISPDGSPVVAWTDESGGVPQIFARRWDSASWVEIGSGSASGGGISNNSGWSTHPSLSVTPDGSPIAAWHDGSTGRLLDIYVRLFDGTSWVEVGSGSATGGGISHSAGDSTHPTIAICPDGTPIVAWSNYFAATRQIFARRWDGKAWVEIGDGSASNQGISHSGGRSDFPSLAIAPDCEPAVAWNNDLNGFDEIYLRRWLPIPPPTAEFTAVPSSGLTPLVVEFTNLSTGKYDECIWDFGDGRTKTTCGNPTRKFTVPGRYTISLTVKGPGGKDGMTKRDYIIVIGPPTADFSASPTSGLPPLTVTFTNLSTGEFDECLWDFGNGVTKTTCDDPSTKYRSEGSYTVSLTVKGTSGADTKTTRGYIQVGFYRIFLPGVLVTR